MRGEDAGRSGGGEDDGGQARKTLVLGPSPRDVTRRVAVEEEADQAVDHTAEHLDRLRDVTRHRTQSSDPSRLRNTHAA